MNWKRERNSTYGDKNNQPAAPVVRIGAALDQAAFLQPAEHGRGGAAGQAGIAGQFPPESTP